MRVQNKRLFVAFPFLVLICFGLWFMRSYYLRAVYDYQQVYSENGTWDLTEVDFQNGFVRLYGKGEFLADVLADPEEFDLYLDQMIYYGGYAEQSVTTTRLNLLVPEGQAYMIVGPSVEYGDKTFLNGQVCLTAGVVSEDEQASVPGYGYLAAEVGDEGGTIEIVRQVNSFVHRMSNDPVNLYIGSPEIMRQYVSLETGMAGVVMGIFFALFLCHMLLYAMLRRYRANLFFAILCLCWCLRSGVTERRLFADWFPGLPWAIMFRIEYLTVAVAVLSIILVINELFPAALPTWLIRFLLGFTGVYALMSLFMPTKPLSYMALVCPAVYIPAMPVICFYLVRYLRAKRRDGGIEVEQWTMILSILFLAFAVGHDAFYYQNLILFRTMNELGFMMFAMTQMFGIFYGTMREVERVHRAEQDLRLESETLRQVNQLKEEFLHNLSHELQMPITVMSGFSQLTAQMMDDDPLDREAIRDHMLRVVDEAEHMERMVTSLLDAAAMETGSFRLQMEPVDMMSLVQTVASHYFPVMDRGNNRITVDGEPELLVRGDREQLQQILLNLISNAVKHTRDGTVSVSVHRAGEMASITVRDTGTGFPPTLLPELFQRFSKHRSSGGNGLGLYICKMLVEAHGGEIGAENRDGALVWFTVPLWKE